MSTVAAEIQQTSAFPRKSNVYTCLKIKHQPRKPLFAYKNVYFKVQEHAYSNLGYEVLGRVIESVTHKKYDEYVKELLSEVGITRMQLGRTKKENTEPDEV